jgi:hypothetical protein
MLFFLVSAWAACAGSAAEESTASFGAYISAAGTVIPPEQIITSSFIGKIDYHYPQPDEPLGATVYSGHRQVAASGQEEHVVIGLQGRRADFENLPPMNVSFVIDKSGSMAAEGKMRWVKESFDIFVNQVRDRDYVALVVFDSTASVIFPSTRMAGKRLSFKQAVHTIAAGGGTNLTAGLKLGYEQVLSNFRTDYTNRVLFLTDGEGRSEGMLDMAASYADMGIHVSTIGLGTNFDMTLMRELAREGEGSSRFISDRETMVEAFGAGLGRMAISVARDVRVEVNLAEEIRLLDTWAYAHESTDRGELYTFPSVHLCDYETIVLKVDIPPGIGLGQYEIGRVSVSYIGEDGEKAYLPPLSILVEAVEMELPVDGISNAIVLGAGTLVEFAEGLKEIGREYEKAQGWIGIRRDQLIERLIDETNYLKNVILNMRTRLDYHGFSDELDILESYLRIFGEELGMDAGKVNQIWNNKELDPGVENRTLMERIGGLFQEMALDLDSRNPGTIAISGFAVNDGRESGLCDLLDKVAEDTLVDVFTVVERDRIGKVMDEMKLILSDLVETTTAIRVGHMLSAEYILTGTIIPMPTTAIVFSRIIHVESSVIKATAQIIVPMTADVRSLLSDR